MTHWRRNLLLLSLSILTGSTPTVAAKPGAGRQVAQRFTSTEDKSLTIGYLLFLPDGYRVRQVGTRQKSWPLLLFLHGSGERGDDLNLVKKHGPPKIVERKPDFPFVVVSPQCPKMKRFDPILLTALLNDIQRQHNIDPRRI